MTPFSCMRPGVSWRSANCTATWWYIGSRNSSLSFSLLSSSLRSDTLNSGVPENTHTMDKCKLLMNVPKKETENRLVHQSGQLISWYLAVSEDYCPPWTILDSSFKTALDLRIKGITMVRCLQIYHYLPLLWLILYFFC